MPDIFLYTGETNPFDVRLRDPTISGAYTLSAAQGSYALTGQTAAFVLGYTVTSAQGSYLLTGEAVNLVFGYTLSVAQGSYALTGEAVNLILGYVLAAAQGSYALTGEPINLVLGYTLTAAQGSYALTGQSVNLVLAQTLTASTGYYTLTGEAVDLTASTASPISGTPRRRPFQRPHVGRYTPVPVDLVLSAKVGTFTQTGSDAGFLLDYALAASAGVVSAVTKPTHFVHGRRLTATHGAFEMIGGDVEFLVEDPLVDEAIMFLMAA